MSTLFDALANTLCLQKSGTNTRLTESRHKLEGTYIYFQGVPVLIEFIHGSEGFRIRYVDGRSCAFPMDSNAFSIDSIKPFDLESGVYLIGGIPVEIKRKVKKYYKKSFYPDAYIFECLDAGRIEKFHGAFSYFDLFNLKRQTIYQYRDKLYYGRKVIGMVNSDKTLMVSNLFTHEVQEAIKSGTIKIQ